MSAATDSPDTRAARSAIFDSLRQGAGANAPLPDLAPFFSGAFGRGVTGSRVDPVELIAPFETAARSWRADVLRARLDEWPRAVRAALDARRCSRVAIGTRGALQPAAGAHGELEADVLDPVGDFGSDFLPADFVYVGDQVLHTAFIQLDIAELNISGQDAVEQVPV